MSPPAARGKPSPRGPFRIPRARVCDGCVVEGVDVVLGRFTAPGRCSRCGVMAVGKIVEYGEAPRRPN